MATYAVSDLHGQYKTFIKGLETIGFSDSDELYLIGDAIDRGPDGIMILQYIKDHSNMDLIIGNHEFMMLNSVSPDGEDELSGQDWDLWLFYNGGRPSFEQYRGLGEGERKSLLFWLNRRYVIKTIDVEGRRFCLTHSYYYPAFENKLYYELEYFNIWDIVWRSVYRGGDTHAQLSTYDLHDYTFITGHVPVQKARIIQGVSAEEANQLNILVERNLVDIDGGCTAGYDSELNNGALFLRLNDMKEFPIPVVE